MALIMALILARINDIKRMRLTVTPLLTPNPTENSNARLAVIP